MRTTIDFPDDLYRKLKVQAAMQGTTVRELVLKGAKEQLKLDLREGKENWRPWYGALKEHRQEIHKLQAFIDEEFSKVDLEEWK